MFKILIIEDDKGIREGLSELLLTSNYVPLVLDMNNIIIRGVQAIGPFHGFLFGMQITIRELKSVLNYS